MFQFLCFSAVLDEVDILYNDEDFELALQSLVNSAAITAQYLFVTATLPVEIYNKLVEVFPDCEVIMGPGMHRTSARLEEVSICLYFLTYRFMANSVRTRNYWVYVLLKPSYLSQQIYQRSMQLIYQSLIMT